MLRWGDLSRRNAKRFTFPRTCHTTSAVRCSSRSMRTSPAVAFIGTPIYNAYLRLMGAKIGRGVIISSRHGPVCADLLTIGDNTILRKDTIVLGYRAQSNFIHVAPVEIGSNAFVGEASVLDIDTTMGDDTQLGHASSTLASPTKAFEPISTGASERARGVAKLGI